MTSASSCGGPLTRTAEPWSHIFARTTWWRLRCTGAGIECLNILATMTGERATRHRVHEGGPRRCECRHFLWSGKRWSATLGPEVDGHIATAAQGSHCDHTGHGPQVLCAPDGSRTRTGGDFKSPASASWATGARPLYAAPRPRSGRASPGDDDAVRSGRVRRWRGRCRRGCRARTSRPPPWASAAGPGRAPRATPGHPRR